jgi:hypothetical protein
VVSRSTKTRMKWTSSVTSSCRCSLTDKSTWHLGFRILSGTSASYPWVRFGRQ